MTIDFSDETQVSNYLYSINRTDKQQYRWAGYHQSVKHAHDMGIHFNGEKPVEILEETRPNEPSEIKAYRLQIYQPITQSKAEKVANSIQRLGNTNNYSIVFPEDELKQYIEKDYPIHGNYLDFVFNIALKQDLVDPNGIICFKPLEGSLKYTEDGNIIDSGEYVDIYGYVYNSCHVVDKYEDEYYTVLLNEKALVDYGNGKQPKGNIYDVYTKNEIIRFTQTGKFTDHTFEQSTIYQHNQELIPVISLGGVYVNDSYPILYKSYVSGVLPYWNKVIRLDSDTDANYIQHLYLERVEIQVECDNEQCGKNGADMGHVCSGEKKFATCTRCKGTGYVSGRSPYGVTTVKKDALAGENAITFPGVTYIDKPTDIVELCEKKMTTLIDEGYAAINMEFLSSIGQNNSGDAKALDRSEWYSFMTPISNNTFDSLIQMGIYYIAALRYGVIGEDIEKMMPVINKPQTFDYVSNEYLIQSLSAQNIPQEIKDKILLELINKQFANDEQGKLYQTFLIELNPLRGKTLDEIIAGVSAGFIEESDAYISQNIASLLKRAMIDKGFVNLDYDKKIEILKSFIPKRETTKIPLLDASGTGQANS